MVRFVVPAIPDDGTSTHPPGSRPDRRTPRPADETTGLINANPALPADHRSAGGPRTSAHDQSRREPPTGRGRRRGMVLRNIRSLPAGRIEGEPASPIQDLTQAAGPCTHRSRSRERVARRACSRGRPSTQPRTVATERAQYGHPAVANSWTPSTPKPATGHPAQPRPNLPVGAQ